MNCRLVIIQENYRETAQNKKLGKSISVDNRVELELNEQ